MFAFKAAKYDLEYSSMAQCLNNSKERFKKLKNKQTNKNSMEIFVCSLKSEDYGPKDTLQLWLV